MSAITVRRLPEGVEQRLRLRAAVNGRSVEAEVRCILVDALHADRRVDLDWVDGLMAFGTELGGVELPEAPDDPGPAPHDH